MTHPERTVLLPRSPEEAMAAFRADPRVRPVGGGTIVVPDARAGRTRPERALLLTFAGLDTISRADGVVRIGAGVTLDRLGEAPAPIPTVAAHVADREIRAQATLGGNLCARSGEAVSRGDLQVPLIALGARVHVATTEGEEVRDVEEFVDRPAEGVLVLAVELDERPRLTGTARLTRPHTHSYTALHVCLVAEERDGALTGVRAVAGGLADTPVRLPGVAAALDGRARGDVDPTEVGRACRGVTARSDALASGWYRERVLPVLVQRACADLLALEERR